jgi:hypothetical protein
MLVFIYQKRADFFKKGISFQLSFPKQNKKKPDRRRKNLVPEKGFLRQKSIGDLF